VGVADGVALADQAAPEARDAVRVRKAQAGRPMPRHLRRPEINPHPLPAKVLPRTANVAGAAGADPAAVSEGQAALVAAAQNRRMPCIAGRCCASTRRPAT